MALARLWDGGFKNMAWRWLICFKSNTSSSTQSPLIDEDQMDLIIKFKNAKMARGVDTIWMHPPKPSSLGMA
jgi:hypothetical protein